MRRPHLTTVVCLDVIRLSFFELGAGPAARRKMRRPHLTTVVCLDVIRLSFFELRTGPITRRKMRRPPIKLYDIKLLYGNKRGWVQHREGAKRENIWRVGLEVRFFVYLCQLKRRIWIQTTLDRGLV